MPAGSRIPDIWTAPQRGVLIALTLALLGLLVFRYLRNPSYTSDPQPIEPPRFHDLADRIDPNTADWPAFAALPTLGQKRAKEIVAYRETFLQQHPDQLPFAQLRDLQHIKGIGPATLTALEPYLLFPQADPPTIAPTDQP